MKTKTFQSMLEIKSHAIKGKFSGYASMFNVLDQYGDIILPGAFKETLKQKQRIQLLWQHDHKEPIGYFEVVEETVNGLYVEGRLLLELAKANDAYLLMKEGVVGGLSIGFEVCDFYHAEGVRYITALKLWEISLVTFPANPAARIAEVKGDVYYDLCKLQAALDMANAHVKNGGQY